MAQDDEEIEEIEKDEEGKDINHVVHQDVIVENDEHDDEQVDAIEDYNHKHYKNQTMGNSEFMQMARESLKGKWGLAVGAYLIVLIITIVAQFLPILGIIIGLLIGGPLGVGICYFTLNISRNQEATVGQVFEGFNNFETAFSAHILRSIFIFLWTLLLIIPGIIATYRYAMTYYILADDKTIGGMDALRKSSEMMEGNKWRLFLLHLNFLGWAVLCILTFGIGLLWLYPYMGVSVAKFYDDIKSNRPIH